MDRRTWTTLIDYRNIDKEENGTLSILEDVTQALMLPNQPTKPIKRAGSKRRRSSALKGLVDGKIPVLGNQNEVNSTFTPSPPIKRFPLKRILAYVRTSGEFRIS